MKSFQFGLPWLLLSLQLTLAVPQADISIRVDRPQWPRLFPRANVSTLSLTSTIVPSTILATILPSPSADPILITSQSQRITSFYPQYTLCPIPSSRSGPLPAKRQIFQSPNATFPYSNSTTIAASNLTACSTAYLPTFVPICQTTLTPAGGVPVTITDCRQKVTFSTNHGLTSTKGGKALLLTTKYVAPWASIVNGVLIGTLQANVCINGDSCTTYLESWGTRAVEAISTTTSIIRLSTVVTGPGVMIINPLDTITISTSGPSTVSFATTFQVAQTLESYIIVPFTLRTLIPTPTPQYGSQESGGGNEGLEPPTTIYVTSTSTLFVTVQTGPSVLPPQALPDLVPRNEIISLNEPTIPEKEAAIEAATSSLTSARGADHSSSLSAARASKSAANSAHSSSLAVARASKSQSAAAHSSSLSAARASVTAERASHSSSLSAARASKVSENSASHASAASAKSASHEMSLSAARAAKSSDGVAASASRASVANARSTSRASGRTMSA